MEIPSFLFLNFCKKFSKEISKILGNLTSFQVNQCERTINNGITKKTFPVEQGISLLHNV